MSTKSSFNSSSPPAQETGEAQEQWFSHDGIEVRYDGLTRSYVGRYTMFSAGRTVEEAVAATKSALRIMAKTEWIGGKPEAVSDPLITALREYGQHKDDCALTRHARAEAEGNELLATIIYSETSTTYEPAPPRRCTCGFSDALSSLTGSQEQK